MIVTPWVLLIFTYAMFIPNTWQRAAAVLGFVGALPIALLAYFYTLPAYTKLLSANRIQWFHQRAGPDHRDRRVLTAVVGVHTIGTLRREAFAAKQLGQYRLEAKARLRRHGRSLSGRAPDDEAAVRREIDPPREGRRPANAGPLRTRSAGHRETLALEFDRHLRLRPHRRRHVLLRDGVPARPQCRRNRRRLRADSARLALCI